MDTITRGQVNHSAAEIYDAFFLPALFEEWPARVLESAQIKSGQSVLDVACGTGVLTLAVDEKVKPNGSVIGLDINEGMLAVARIKAPAIEWRQSQAESLPFPDDQFDAVVSQFGLMFFDDRHTAIQEMVRVLKPGGRLAIAVWDSLDNTPGYAAMTALLQRLFGNSVAEALEAPFVLGNLHTLQALFDAVALDVDIHTCQGTARFPSLTSWMFTDIKGWTLADKLDDTQFNLLLKEGKEELQKFVGEDGTVSFSSPAHIVTACKK